jgi:hypothetical protein
MYVEVDGDISIHVRSLTEKSEAVFGTKKWGCVWYQKVGLCLVPKSEAVFGTKK